MPNEYTSTIDQIALDPVPAARRNADRIPALGRRGGVVLGPPMEHSARAGAGARDRGIRGAE